LLLAGFSFGAVVAMRAAAAAQPAWLVSIAPAVDRVPLAGFTAPGCPWLIVQGDADEVVPAVAVLEWVAQLAARPTLRVLGGVGHFFHGRLHELQDCLREEWPATLKNTGPGA
jgi:alpha/beta superfamily hydrolase